MICRNSTAPHNCSNHRYICLFHHLTKQLICSGNIHASQEQWPFRFIQSLDSTFQLTDMHIGIGLVSADVHTLRILCAAKFSHYILGKIDQYRAWPACTCNIKCFFDDPSQIFPSAHSHPILGNTACDPYNINFLESVITDQITCNLTGKAYQGHTVIIGSSKSCYQIGSSRAACHQAYAYLSCGPCISICRMHQCLLMTWQDNGNIVLLVQFVAYINGTGTRIPEKVFHAFFFQSFYKQFIPRNLFHVCS